MVSLVDVHDAGLVYVSGNCYVLEVGRDGRVVAG